MLTDWLFQLSGKSIEKPILSKLSTAKPSSGPEEPSPICRLRIWWIPTIRDPLPKLSEIWIPLPNSWRKGGMMKVHLPWHPLRLKLPYRLKPTVPLMSKCTNWSKPTTSSNNSCCCPTSQLPRKYTKGSQLSAFCVGILNQKHRIFKCWGRF